MFARSARPRKPGRKSSGTRRGGTGDGRGHKFKGRFQFRDIDEDGITRLARRKMSSPRQSVAAVSPVAIWIRVVTDYGRAVMMNADQFDAGGIKGVKSAVPHFG